MKIKIHSSAIAIALTLLPTCVFAAQHSRNLARIDSLMRARNEIEDNWQSQYSKFDPEQAEMRSRESTRWQPDRDRPSTWERRRNESVGRSSRRE